MYDIQDVQREVHKTACEKGWWDKPRDVGELLANVHAEVSESWEEYRRPDHDLGLVYYRHDSLKPEGFPVELADIIIRVLDIADHYNINMAHVINTKMRYNRTRPYRHGNKVA